MTAPLIYATGATYHYRAPNPLRCAHQFIWMVHGDDRCYHCNVTRGDWAATRRAQRRAERAARKAARP